MATNSIQCLRVNHINLVVPDLEAGVAHLASLYGAERMMDLPQRELNACLIGMGGVIFELFQPHEFLLVARYGAHYLGIEYRADMAEVREAIAARGVRIARDIGIALHTHPADCFGVSLEFWDGAFHDMDFALLGGRIKPAGYWRDEHPLGLTGLKGYTVAVADIAGASRFFEELLNGKRLYDEARPAIAGRAIGLNIADAVLELVTPVADGALREHLYRYGDGIRSTLFGVRDIAQAKRYFGERGVDVVPGTAPGSIAVPADPSLGGIFEFME